MRRPFLEKPKNITSGSNVYALFAKRNFDVDQKTKRGKRFPDMRKLPNGIGNCSKLATQRGSTSPKCTNGTGQHTEFCRKRFEKLLMPPGQDKGAALEMVLQKLDLPASSMVALGDGLNDLGMLRLAGTSIAMQNAVDAAKDVAGMVSEKSNDVRATLLWRCYTPVLCLLWRCLRWRCYAPVLCLTSRVCCCRRRRAGRTCWSSWAWCQRPGSDQ